MSDDFNFDVPGGNGMPNNRNDSSRNNDDVEGSYKRLLGDKPITWFWLMQHYSKPNAAAYKAQKEARKAAKKAQKDGRNKNQNQSAQNQNQNWNQNAQNQNQNWNQNAQNQNQNWNQGAQNQNWNQGAQNQNWNQGAQSQNQDWSQGAQNQNRNWDQSWNQGAQNQNRNWDQSWSQSTQNQNRNWDQSWNQSAQNQNRDTNQSWNQGAQNQSWNQNWNQGARNQQAQNWAQQNVGNFPGGANASANIHDGKTVVFNKKAGSAAGRRSFDKVVASIECLNYDQSIDVSSSPFYIGRGEDSVDLCLSGNLHISSKHVEISYENGTFYMTDLGSANHTWLNDKQIAANQPTILSDGDRISLADEEFIFHKR